VDETALTIKVVIVVLCIMFVTLAAIVIILQMTLNQSNTNYKEILEGQTTLNQTLVNINRLLDNLSITDDILFQQPREEPSGGIAGFGAQEPVVQEQPDVILEYDNSTAIYNATD
jgi:predicted PurR-regulated permease PerM